GRGQEQVVALAGQHRLPSMMGNATFTARGGLISYGADTSELNRQAGVYVARILRGEKPADLPVVQPTKFELWVNLKTANALGLSIPESFLLLADKVSNRDAGLLRCVSPQLYLPIDLRHRPRDGSVVSSLHCMNDPQPEGQMASDIGRRKFLATLS